MILCRGIDRLEAFHEFAELLGGLFFHGFIIFVPEPLLVNNMLCESIRDAQVEPD